MQNRRKDILREVVEDVARGLEPGRRRALVEELDAALADESAGLGQRLTPEEDALVSKIGSCYGDWLRIVKNDPAWMALEAKTREQDIAEFCSLIHSLQYRVMKRILHRIDPESYRP